MRSSEEAKGFAIEIGLLLLSFFVLTIPGTVNAQEEDVEFDWGSELAKTGTYFEITESEYLNVTLTSTDTVYAHFASEPNLVSYHIESRCQETSTQITISGFEPNRTYYQYEDGYLVGEITMDGDGSYFYIQNISVPHYVYIQEERSTIYIWEDGSIDPPTAPITVDGNIYTLTGNVYESIGIHKPGITLDGAGYTLQRLDRQGYGIVFHRKSNVTIRNFNIEGFARAIMVHESTPSTITNNTISNTGYAIFIYGKPSVYSPGFTITNNEISNVKKGIRLYRSHNNIVTNNRVLANNSNRRVYDCNLTIFGSRSNIVTNNLLSGNDWGIWLGYYTKWNNINSNTFCNNRAGMQIDGYSYENMITCNTVLNNTYGFYFRYDTYENVFYHNNIIDNTNQLYSIYANSSTNIWDNGAGEGNHWSDYIGLDDGSDGRTAEDGIGDTDIPHLGVDSYPLMDPYGSQPPIANAGPDYSVNAGEIASLDGTASYDDNTETENLIYNWAMRLRPEGSMAVLLNADTDTPSFLADFPGTYEVTLVVTDEGDQSSCPDEVIISSLNLAPTADAGLDASAAVGSSVYLDGTGSSDPNGDALDYMWMITGKPEGSLSELDGDTGSTPSFTPDLPGQYTIELIVFDGWENSDPDEVLISAIIPGEFAKDKIREALDILNGLGPECVTTKGNKRALGNFLTQALAALQEDDVEEAINKLNKSIDRTDGYVLRGVPDGNGPGRDWITCPNAQEQIYQLLNDALNALYL
jgi:parallel beta-helix repeat protein